MRIAHDFFLIRAQRAPGWEKGIAPFRSDGLGAAFAQSTVKVERSAYERKVCEGLREVAERFARGPDLL